MRGLGAFVFSWLLVLLLTAQDQNKPERHVVVISIDGLRPEFYLSDDFETPTLKALVKNGAYAKACETVFPSLTYPAHTSIVTGVLPAKHGIFANTLFSMDTGPSPRWYWETEHLKAPTLWQIARKNGRTVGICFWPVSVGADVNWLLPEVWSLESHKETLGLMFKHGTKGLFAEMALAAGVPKFENLKSKAEVDPLIAGAAAYILGRYKPHLMLIHMAGTDEIQHKHSRDDPKVKEIVKAIDAQIARIVKAAEKAKLNAVFVVVGDHGFEDYRETVSPNVVLAQAGLIDGDRRFLKAWKAYAHTTGGSCGVFAKDEESAKKAREALEKAAVQKERILYRIIDRKELDQLGYDPRAAFALVPEKGIAFDSSREGELTRAGDGTHGTHGHLPTRAGLATGFIAGGPGIKKGLVLDRMHVIDIGPTLAKLMGLEMKDVDGRVLDILE